MGLKIDMVVARPSWGTKNSFDRDRLTKNNFKRQCTDFNVTCDTKKTSAQCSLDWHTAPKEYVNTTLNSTSCRIDMHVNG